MISCSQAAEVTSMRVERMDEGLYLSASLNLDIPAPIEDALLKGIALIFVSEVEVLRERWYWTDKKVLQASRSLRLSYQPLTRRWRLSQGGAESGGLAGRAGLAQTFDSLADAVNALESIARWRIGEAADIEAGASHLLNFRFRLDAAQLPRPFQFGIAGQRDWQLNLEVRQPLKLTAPEARP